MQYTHDIYTFWKDNPNVWFNATEEDDKYISEKFMGYYIQSINDINDNMQSINKEEWTGYCILHDQLIKHFNRHYGLNMTAPDNFLINCYDKYKYLKHHNLNDFEFMFMLMPLRHTHQLIHVEFVLNETWKRLELNLLSENKDNQFIRKFLVATYERYIKCTSEHNLIKYIDNKYKFNHFEILDDNSSASLDCSPSIDIVEETIFSVMQDFIKSNKINQQIIISLSGGVDSMVCSYILKALNVNLSAVHIDYYNRAECEKEEKLLIWWCNTILKIPLYIRRIDEINRPKCMEYELRDLYESYTKNVRFNSYINVGEYVVLGHNKDDTIENIFTNTASQSHYENLLGMTPISNQSYKDKNICFLRPLINIPKKDIYDFAIKYNIPFLQDSTPKWSQRGKIRDIVKPALNEWNPLIFDGLINLSATMGQMTLLINKLISKDFNYNNINEVPIDSIYWNIVLKKNNIHVTQKTLINLINRIQHYKQFPHKLRDTQKIQLKTQSNTIYKNTLLVLKQSSKPVERLHINFSFI